MKTKHSLIDNFKFAFEGLVVALKKGRNVKIMVGFGILAVVLGMATRIGTSEWIQLVLIISLVLGLEMLNTALEAIVDLVSPEFNALAKAAKDMAAGAVLIVSIASVIIGTLLFLPKLTF